jgi:hypothetical protein
VHGEWRFASVDDVARRCDLRQDDVEALAKARAFESLAPSRRAALWQARLRVRPACSKLTAYKNRASACPTCVRASDFCWTIGTKGCPWAIIRCAISATSCGRDGSLRPKSCSAVRRGNGWRWRASLLVASSRPPPAASSSSRSKTKPHFESGFVEPCLQGVPSTCPPCFHHARARHHRAPGAAHLAYV